VALGHPLVTKPDLKQRRQALKTALACRDLRRRAARGREQGNTQTQATTLINLGVLIDLGVACIL
jgi:hypothetical protein